MRAIATLVVALALAGCACPAFHFVGDQRPPRAAVESFDQIPFGCSVDDRGVMRCPEQD
jgi:hypothetical protein